MKRQTFNSFCKKHPLLALVSRISKPNLVSISNVCSLIEVLNKYGMINGHITTESYEIFRNRDIIETFDGFIIHNLLDLRFLESITITQHVSHDSCLEDFNTIYQNLSRNIDNITLFQNKFNIQISIDIHIKAFDSGKAITISNFIVNNDIDCINFIFEFPTLNKNLAFCLISNLEQFCMNPILRNTRIRLQNFPFCFIPAARYKCLYRNIVVTLKSDFFLQRDTIRKLKGKKFTYFKPCRECRCRVPCYAYTNIQQFPEYCPFLSPKTQNTVVFVGGSLQEMKRYADDNIVYTTPAEQGDMFMAILEGFENIIIIDGYFYSKFPCTTFEIMLALENGINVFGSSSIGALRAVELDNYGMVGMGYVYKYLKKQYIKPYHIVAQTYNESDIPLTIPLVDIIYFLECALSEGVIIKDEFDDCFSVANNIHFTLLSFEYFFKQLKSEKKVPADVISKLENYISRKGEQTFNIKKKDAIMLLNEFRNILKNRSRDYVKKAFNQAKEKYLKILYGKYRCNYDLTLTKDWKLSYPKDRISIFYSLRGNRDYSPEKTCELAKKFFENLDIVVADTTKYDPVNNFIINIFFIPFYFLKYWLSSSTGNGDNFKEALASAYMELVERIPCAEFNIDALEHSKIDKEPFPYKDLPQYYNLDVSSRDKTKIFKDSGHVEATDILSNKNIFIPKFVATSIGSGSDGNVSGNSLPEAILYGIYELIERDSSKIYELNPSCHKLMSKLLINKKDIKDRRCQTLLEQFEAKGCKIVLVNLVNIYNIPCVRCFIYDLNHRIARHGGTAVRSDFCSAVYAALQEAYMQYITYFVGTRDDYQSLFNKKMHIEYKRGELMFFRNQNFIKKIPSPVRFNSIAEELEYVINKLVNVDIRHIIVVNTSPNNEYGVKSVKVIIPKLELEAIQEFRPSPFLYKKGNRTIRLIRHLTG